MGESMYGEALLVIAILQINFRSIFSTKYYSLYVYSCATYIFSTQISNLATFGAFWSIMTMLTADMAHLQRQRFLILLKISEI